jgi:hypothetical protein
MCTLTSFCSNRTILSLIAFVSEFIFHETHLGYIFLYFSVVLIPECNCNYFGSLTLSIVLFLRMIMSKNSVMLLIYHRHTVLGLILVLSGHSSTCSLPYITTVSISVIKSIVLIFEVIFYSHFKGDTPIATTWRRVMFRQVFLELPAVKFDDNPFSGSRFVTCGQAEMQPT